MNALHSVRTSRCSRPQSRPGFTLLETVIAVALLSALLTMSAQLLHTLLLTSDQTHRLLTDQNTYQRLSVQLRQDAHRATAVRLEPSTTPTAPPQLIFEQGDSQIVYQQLARGIERTTQRREQSSSHRDVFHLPVKTVEVELPTPDNSLLNMRITLRSPVEAGQKRYAYGVPQQSEIRTRVGILQTP